MKLAIITDGSNTLGLGHIYQSLTLANILKGRKKSVEIFFITKSDPEIIELLKKSGCSVLYFKDDRAIFNALKEKKTDRIIFEKLNVSPELAQKIKEELPAKLIIMTNLTDANKYADVTLMAAMGSNFKNICRKDNVTGKMEFWGPSYLLLRPEFYKYQDKKTKNGKIKNIMLMFGGSDQANLTSSVLDALLKINQSFTITIVLGSAFLHQEELRDIIDNNQSNSTIIHLENITNVAEVMHFSDLVFTSPGLSFFEALLVGTPVLCFPQNDFQYNAWKDDIKTFDRDDLKELSKIVENKLFIYPDDPLISLMEIGQKYSEIIDAILN